MFMPPLLTLIWVVGSLNWRSGAVWFGPLAQLAEQLTLNQQVLGSTPRRVTIFSFKGGRVAGRRGEVSALADEHDLGSCALGRAGSSPAFPTKMFRLMRMGGLNTPRPDLSGGSRLSAPMQAAEPQMTTLEYSSTGVWLRSGGNSQIAKAGRRRCRAGVYLRHAGLEERRGAAHRRPHRAHRAQRPQGGALELALVRRRGRRLVRQIPRLHPAT